jgi:hypothetical protein
MEPAELKIALLPLSDEVASWDVQDAFGEFATELQSHDVPISAQPLVVPPGYVGGAPDLLSGEFLLRVIPTIGPLVATAAGAWLHARYGRKVRIKAGDIEAEAQTAEEVEKLLNKAFEIQKRTDVNKKNEP